MAGIMPNSLEKDRLELLNAVEGRGSKTIESICREFNVTRGVYYKFFKRYKTNGLEGLRDESRRPRTNCRALSDEDKKGVEKLSLMNPLWGCKRIAEEFGDGKISATSVFNIQKQLGIGTITKRVRAIETNFLQSKEDQTPEIWELLAKHNPTYQEFRSRKPLPKDKNTILLGLCYAGTIRGEGRLQIIVAMDAGSMMVSSSINYARGMKPHHVEKISVELIRNLVTCSNGYMAKEVQIFIRKPNSHRFSNYYQNQEEEESRHVSEALMTDIDEIFEDDVTIKFSQKKEEVVRLSQYEKIARETFFRDFLKTPDIGKHPIKELQSKYQKWEFEYNELFSPDIHYGFPFCGKTPVQKFKLNNAPS